MPGARATPHERLLTLLVDAGAAFYYIQPKRGTRDFELYLPLLLELAVENKEALVADLKRRTRPFVRAVTRLDYMRMSFYSVLNEERFEMALLSALGDLETYKRPIEFPVTAAPCKVARFPTMTLASEGAYSPDEIALQICRCQVALAAHMVRTRRRGLSLVEKRRLHVTVLPEYVPLLSEAQWLALRIVRFQSIQAVWEDPVESTERSDWLRDCGYMPQPLIRPVRGERCDTERETALVSHAISGLAISTSVTPQAPN